jgi:hypothetical protein
LAFSDPFARFLLGNTYLSLLLVFPIKLLNNNAWAQVVDILRTLDLKETIHLIALFITRNMGQDGDGHAHFDPIWRPNITINYMGVDQNIKF